MANEHYVSFIEEAFVKPIRSVLIVDDDYPTFDEILANQMGLQIDAAKAWHTNPGRIKGVIDRFRAPGRPLLVDIHDGTNVTVGEEVTVAKHLHQSDLLVLDYQLDRSRQRDGTRSIEIIRSLMSNDHFNLVIVHTSEDLDFVFESVLIGLLRPSSIRLSAEETERAGELIEAGEQASEGFSDRLYTSVANEQFLHSRLFPTTYQRTMGKAQEPYSAFVQQCDDAQWAAEDRKLVLRYVLARIERSLLPAMNANSSADLIWSPRATTWIKSESVFIAFSNKGDDDDLLTELQKALNDWNPQPSRLFLAKLRAEMDEYGVIAQTQALGNKHALAHWYDRLLRADGAERRWYIAESVSRHSDQLMNAILPRVEEFAKRLIAAEVESGDIEVLCKEHFKVDLAKADIKRLAEREHNAFVCSQKPQGWHLTTGHIFLMDADYWLCLSPACDMVPSQLSAARIETVGARLPFVAVRLQPVADGKAVDIQSNRFVFLQLDGAVKGFCFNDPSRDSSAPQWETLYAEKRGEFVEGTFKFTALRSQSGKTRLVSKGYEAVVVSQLRYEYALNLMQRLGGSLTRIGLDFAG
jgi:CheY-like chemotaxis protein